MKSFKLIQSLVTAPPLHRHTWSRANAVARAVGDGHRPAICGRARARLSLVYPSPNAQPPHTHATPPHAHRPNHMWQTTHALKRHGPTPVLVSSCPRAASSIASAMDACGRITPPQPC